MPSSPLATTTGRSSTPCSYCSAMAMWVGLVTTTFDPLTAESMFCCDHSWCNCLRRDLMYGSPSFSLTSWRMSRGLKSVVYGQDVLGRIVYGGRGCNKKE